MTKQSTARFAHNESVRIFMALPSRFKMLDQFLYKADVGLTDTLSGLAVCNRARQLLSRSLLMMIALSGMIAIPVTRYLGMNW